MKWFVVLCLAVAVIADVNIQRYHELVGIPLAARIKAAEDEAMRTGSRIVGGQPAPLGAHPYLVGVIIHRTIWTSACGSSLLSNTRAITAAHCWVDVGTQSDSFTMVFGSEHLFYGGVRRDTSDVLVHSGWNPSNLNTLENDLAIVRFDHVDFTDVIQPISLPVGELANNDFVGVWAQASGYGMLGDGIFITPDQVQSHVTLQVLSNSVCSQYFVIGVTENILCTSGVGPVGTCSSDSGGPLSIINDGERVLIGVVSFGSSSCNDGRPSGFVRVTSHLPWIQERL